jgi:MFS family permease
MTRPPTPGRASEQPGTDRRQEFLAAWRGRPPVSGRAFWLAAFVFLTAMMGTTLPTPLYDIYQAEWHLSASMITLIYAVYAVGVLVTLLLAGQWSDLAGRRPIMAVSLACSALSTLVFILAHDVEVVLVGRILSGLSAGLMTPTATALLTEFDSSPTGSRGSRVATAANMGGLGLGPLVAGLFAQYLPHPTSMVFEVYLVVLAAAGVCLFLIPETVRNRQRPTLRFAGLSVPRRRRREFVAAGVAGFAAFALLGLFTSLAPDFLGGVLHESSHAVQGAVVSLLLMAATVAQLVLSRREGRRLVAPGLALFLAALALTVSALALASMALFLAGTIVGGIAVGAVFLGSIGTAGRLAPPARRAQVVSTFFVLCYSGLIIPVIGVGVTSGLFGDFPAVLGFSILISALCVYSLVNFRKTL